MEIYNWNWMVLDALGCINNADFGENKLYDIYLILCN